MELDDIALGQKIRDIRLRYGDTQAEFANRLGISSKATVNNWEKGRNKPNKKKLKRISELGNITVDELINSDKNVPANIKRGFGLLQNTPRTFNDMKERVNASQVMIAVLNEELKNMEEKDFDEYTGNELDVFFQSSINSLDSAYDAFKYFSRKRDEKNDPSH